MSDAAHKSADAHHEDAAHATAAAEAGHKTAEAGHAEGKAAETHEAKPSKGILSKLWAGLTWPVRKIAQGTWKKVKKTVGNIFDVNFDDDPSLGLSQALGKAKSEAHHEEKTAEKTHKPPKHEEKAKEEHHAKLTEAKESHETVSELSLEVADHCNNPKGHYIGLSEKQREKLGVKVDDEVTLEITDDHGKKESKTYKVGMGKKELVDKADQFTANEIPKGSKVVVKKKAAGAHATTAAAHAAPANDVKEHEKAGHEAPKAHAA